MTDTYKILGQEVALSNVEYSESFVALLGGTGDDRGSAKLAIDSQDNVYFAGLQNSAGAGDYDYVVAKWNSAGVLQWQRFLGGSGFDTNPQIAIDSLDNVYLAGAQSSAGAGSYDFVVAKWNSAGVLQWQRFLGGGSEEADPQIVIDSQGNIYLAGRQDSAGAGNLDFVVAKWNSDGVFQWQRFLGGAEFEFSAKIAIDSLDNVYLVGIQASTGAGNQDIVIAKWNSAGVLQWQRFFGGGNNESSPQIAIDSLDNVYLVGTQQSDTVGNSDYVVAKWNSAGVLQWQRFLGGSSDENSPQIAVDSADNVYLVGNQRSAGAGFEDYVVAKWNSAGVLQWQRFFGGGSEELSVLIAIDSLDNVYLVGNQRSAGAGGAFDVDFVVAKWNSDGVFQWQRFLGGTSIEDDPQIAIDSLDNVYLVGAQSSAGYSGFEYAIAKLPPEGITGTFTITPDFGFGALILQEGTLTEQAGSFTEQEGSLTEQAGSLTEQEGSLTEQAGSLTEQEGTLDRYTRTFLTIDTQDSVVYTVPTSTNTSISTIALINTGTESATYKLAAVPADEVSSQTAVIAATGETKPEFKDAKAIIPTKTIEPNTTHEILGGITLSAGDQIRVNSDSADLIVQVYGVEIV